MGVNSSSLIEGDDLRTASDKNSCLALPPASRHVCQPCFPTLLRTAPVPVGRSGRVGAGGRERLQHQRSVDALSQHHGNADELCVPRRRVQSGHGALQGEQAPAAPVPTRDSQSPFAVDQIVSCMERLLCPATRLGAQISALCTSLSAGLGHNCPLPLFVLTLAQQIAPLGCCAAIHNVRNTCYWSTRQGSSFLVCREHGRQGQSAGAKEDQVIVSLGFRDLFTTPHVTDRYRQVLGALPELFVGRTHELLLLLRLVCYEMTLMFESQGRQLPPWRSFEVLASRWTAAPAATVPVPMTERGRLSKVEVCVFLVQAKRLFEGPAWGITAAATDSVSAGAGLDQATVQTGETRVADVSTSRAPLGQQAGLSARTSTCHSRLPCPAFQPLTVTTGFEVQASKSRA